MSSPNAIDDRLAKILLTLAGIGFPTTFIFAWTRTQNVREALGLMVIYGGVVIIVGMVTGIWNRILPSLQEGAANEILAAMKRWNDGKYRKPYLQYLIYRNRTFDVKGLSTQGPFSLELEKVFVDLSISPESFPSGNPVPAPHELRIGGHSIWKYINAKELGNLAIVGAPGSGKTTLLKYLTITLATRNRRSAKHVPDKLPVLLVLRDHFKTIVENPKVRLTELIRDSLEMMDEKAPEGWFERHLKHGYCLIMLDGLDEIGDPDARQKVVTWVDKQMEVYGGNRFVVTSRPHGYRSNPLKGVTQLEVRPFNRIQIIAFVYNWYLATEIMSNQKFDPGVEMEARKEADELMKRIENTPDIAELAVNPLLLTMIATVHRFRSQLPTRRVELYAEMCEVFLGKSEQARNLPVELTPAQKQSVLQPLAYTMMLWRTREINVSDALGIVAEPLKLVTTQIDSLTFLEMIRDRSGILVERENGVYSFSHKTFQEYLTAAHIDREKLQEELVKRIQNDYWHEAIRLYCAQVDATPIIAACLAGESPPIPLLVLAIECMEEGLKVQPDMRRKLEQIIEDDLITGDPQRRRIAAQARLALRLRRLVHLDDNTYTDSEPITYAEFQLFLEEHVEFTPDHWTGGGFQLGNGKYPVTGITPESGQAFCKWLTEREPATEWFYRLPHNRELADVDSYWIIENNVVRIVNAHLLKYPLSNWLIRSDRILLNQAWMSHTIELNAYNPSAVFTRWRFTLAYILTIANNSLLEMDLGGMREADRARVHNLSDAVYRVCDLANNHNAIGATSPTLALVIACDLALAISQTLDLASPRTSQLAKDISIRLQNTRNRPFSTQVSSASLVAHDLVRILTNNIDNELVTILHCLATVLSGYIYLAIVDDLEEGIPPIHILNKLNELDNFRSLLLHQLNSLQKQQSDAPRFGRREESEAWNEQIDVLLQIYATLAMLERRRSDQWQAFEILRIVKVRELSKVDSQPS